MKSDPAAVLQSLGGWARTTELKQRGISRADLARAVADDAIIRVREGWYAVAGAPSELVAAILHGGVPGCLTAAAAWGLWVPPFEGLHVWMKERSHHRAHSGCSCVTHFDLPRRAEARSVTVEHALFEVARCAGDEAFFACFESALRLGRITHAAPGWLRDVLPSSAAQLIDLARDNADSGLESIFRFRMLRHGVTMLSQVVVPSVGIVDFVIGDRLIVEIDGRVGHETAAERHKDLMRDARAAALGFITLRFDYPMVMHDWATVEAAVLAVVAANLHRSEAGQRS